MPKRLPKPRTQYYVGEPVVVLTLTQLEGLLNHLIDLGLMDRKTTQQQAAVEKRHQLILEECQHQLQQALAFYRISRTEGSERPQIDQRNG